MQNPNALLKNFVDNSANAKIISVLNQGTARPSSATAPQPQAPIAAQADTVTLTSPETAITAILVTAAPEIAQTIKSSIALSDNESNTSELADSIPEEIAPGSQLNLKITAAQNPPENNQLNNQLNIQPGNQQVESGNTILAKADLLQPAAPETTISPTQVLANQFHPQSKLKVQLCQVMRNKLPITCSNWYKISLLVLNLCPTATSP